MDRDQIIQLVVVGGFFLVKLIVDSLKKRQQKEQAAGLPDPDWDELDIPEDDGLYDDALELPELESVDVDAVLAAAVAASTDARGIFLARVAALRREVEELYRSAHLELATRRVADVLDGYLLPRLNSLHDQIEMSGAAPSGDAKCDLADAETVLAVVETLVSQRRHPGLREAIGDADAMAMACYEPVFDFARMNRLPLTSATPVTLLSPFDLGIWTQFITTGVAPIFLPRDFFTRLLWWPAIAHEIGHDFLAATANAVDRLREQLVVASAEVGKQPIVLTERGVAFRDIERVFGVWFDEIFCDVFGTLMVGPAYGYAMLELFATPGNPVAIAQVGVDASGMAYAEHPPRHLRLLLCAHVLELINEDEAARALREEWTALHGEIDGVMFPVVPQGAIGIPIEPLEKVAKELANKLCTARLAAFDGHSLQDIPGVGYGPHESAAARRACTALLAGQPPVNEAPRAVIGGAIMAWREGPEREIELMALARRAIVGVTESREDAYTEVDVVEYDSRGDDLRDALVLHTIFAPPPALRGVRRDPGGLVAGGRWQR